MAAARHSTLDFMLGATVKMDHRNTKVVKDLQDHPVEPSTYHQ